MSDYDRPTGNLSAADCEILDALLPAFAFGLLDENEKQQVEKLLPNCPDRASELADYQALAGKMLHSATPVEPPPDLLLRLLQATAPTASANSDNITLLPKPESRRQTSRFNPGVLAGIAAALVLVVLTGWIFFQTAQLSRTVEAQETLLSLFATDQVVSFELTDPSDTPTNARAVLKCNAGQKVAVLHAEAFPVSADEEFEVWLWLDQVTKISGGFLEIDPAGSGTLIFEAPEVMGTYQYVSITPIPAAGETVKPVVRGSLYPTLPEQQG